jgi:hypothetical protein
MFSRRIQVRGGVDWGWDDVARWFLVEIASASPFKIRGTLIVSSDVVRSWYRIAGLLVSRRDGYR